jgi:hypothetical protein
VFFACTNYGILQRLQEFYRASSVSFFLGDSFYFPFCIPIHRLIRIPKDYTYLGSPPLCFPAAIHWEHGLDLGDSGSVSFSRLDTRRLNIDGERVPGLHYLGGSLFSHLSTFLGLLLVPTTSSCTAPFLAQVTRSA